MGKFLLRKFIKLVQVILVGPDGVHRIPFFELDKINKRLDRAKQGKAVKCIQSYKRSGSMTFKFGKKKTISGKMAIIS